MTGGPAARSGFWFQDATALLRLVSHAAERRARGAIGLPLGHALAIQIEAAVNVPVSKQRTAPRPLWDSTSTVGTRVTVDESKLGGPNRDERIDFYRRLRATALHARVENLTPRITVGRGRVRGLHKWRDLPLAAQRVRPRKPTRAVGSAEDLAAEALYYLTDRRAVFGVTTKARFPPISVTHARALLSRFIFDDSRSLPEVEADLRSALADIGAKMSAQDLVNQLRGWIGDAAKGGALSKVLTAETLVKEVAFAARYLEVPRESEIVWNRLRQATPALALSKIAAQPWRDVQPAIEVGLSGANQRTVFTAPGGVGKSFLLAQLHAEASGERIWIDAQSMVGVEEALAFGAWACGHLSRVVSVFVDGLDHASGPAEVVTTIVRAVAGCTARVFIAARHTTWALVRDSVSAWREVPLAPWTEGRVRRLAGAGRAETLPRDLVDLLRTPLLLDVFLRTFAPSEPVPIGLATRHGVLRAYFDKRILSERDGASDRRRALDVGTATVLANRTHWIDPRPAAQDLVSEGVLVSSMGELRFRHALLRDFAASLLLRRYSAADIASRLAAVTNPTTRSDLLRSVIESSLDPSADAGEPEVEEVVRECATKGLSPSIALGSTDAPTQRLVEAIASLDGGLVFRQAVDRARIVDNRLWIRVISSIGERRPSWLTAIHLEALSRLATYALDQRDQAATELARTLRAWTFGESGETWAMAAILKLVSTLLRDDDTLAWMQSLRIESGVTSGELLDGVREMIVTTLGLDSAAAKRALWNLIFGISPRRALQNQHLWAIARRCLLSDKGKPGLLKKRPDAALPIVFELSALETEQQQRRWRKHNDDPKLQAAFAKLGASDPVASDLADAQERLKLLPTLTADEALGGLVDDAPFGSGGHVDDIDTLFEVTKGIGKRSQTANLVAEAAEQSRSIRARLLVLSCASAANAGRILKDPRCYHSLHSLFALHNAIAAHWLHMDEATRAAIQKNVLQVARSPILSVTAVGRLAGAIPRAELAAELLPYVEFLETTGRPTKPSGPSKMWRAPRSTREERADETGRVVDSPEGRAFARLVEAAVNPAGEEAAHALGDIADRGYLTSDAEHDVWYAASRVLNHDEKANKRRVVTGSQSRQLFTQALTKARQPDARAESSLWTTVMDLADAAAGHIDNQNDEAMRTALFSEVVAAVEGGVNGQEHASHALSFVRAWHWFRKGSPGRELFIRWFRETLEPPALVPALGRLQFLDLATRLELVRHVFETDGRIDAESATTQSFCNEAGRSLGSWTFWSPDPGPLDLVRRWCVSPSRPGVLAVHKHWRAFLDGFAWAFQNALRHANDVTDASKREPAIDRFAQVVPMIWESWPAPEPDDHEAIAWALISPLERDYEGPERPWSSLLRPVIMSVLSTAAHADLSAALHGMMWRVFDQQTLVEAANALIERAGNDDSGLVLHEVIDALENVGTLQLLPLEHACRCLDSLEVLGKRLSRATVAAISIERRIRLQGG